MAMFVVESGDNDASVFVIERDRCVIGKPPAADNPYVSGAHAEVQLVGGRHRIRDLGSKNGTMVNGTPTPAAGYELAEGDRVDLARGHVLLRYTAGSSTITLPPAGPDSTGVVQVDADSREVEVEVAGVRVSPALSRKEFDVLSLLFEQRGKACSKDAIAARGWPERGGGDVGDQEIEQCMRRIRLRVEPDPSQPRFVQTVRGFGYKLG